MYSKMVNCILAFNFYKFITYQSLPQQFVTVDLLIYMGCTASHLTLTQHTHDLKF